MTKSQVLRAFLYAVLAALFGVVFMGVLERLSELLRLRHAPGAAVVVVAVAYAALGALLGATERNTRR